MSFFKNCGVIIENWNLHRSFENEKSTATVQKSKYPLRTVIIRSKLKNIGAWGYKKGISWKKYGADTEFYRLHRIMQKRNLGTTV